MESYQHFLTDKNNFQFSLYVYPTSFSRQRIVPLLQQTGFHSGEDQCGRSSGKSFSFLFQTFAINQRAISDIEQFLLSNILRLGIIVYVILMILDFGLLKLENTTFSHIFYEVVKGLKSK
jgi:hypothetical protein